IEQRVLHERTTVVAALLRIVDQWVLQSRDVALDGIQKVDTETPLLIPTPYVERIGHIHTAARVSGDRSAPARWCRFHQAAGTAAGIIGIGRAGRGAGRQRFILLRYLRGEPTDAPI